MSESKGMNPVAMAVHVLRDAPGYVVAKQADFADLRAEIGRLRTALAKERARAAFIVRDTVPLAGEGLGDFCERIALAIEDGSSHHRQDRNLAEDAL